jgi:hypothetical protein
MNELQPTTVIPVRFQGEGLVIVSAYPNKLEALEKYLLNRDEMVNAGNVADVIGKLLGLVNKIMRDGTEVYEMDFAGLKKKVGRLVFVIETFVASGAYYSWQQIEQEIDSILDDAERQIAKETPYE